MVNALQNVTFICVGSSKFGSDVNAQQHSEIQAEALRDGNDDTLGQAGESGAHIYRRSFYDPQV